MSVTPSLKSLYEVADHLQQTIGNLLRTLFANLLPYLDFYRCHRKILEIILLATISNDFIT